MFQDLGVNRLLPWSQTVKMFKPHMCLQVVLMGGFNVERGRHLNDK